MLLLMLRSRRNQGRSRRRRSKTQWARSQGHWISLREEWLAEHELFEKEDYIPSRKALKAKYMAEVKKKKPTPDTTSQLATGSTTSALPNAGVARGSAGRELTFTTQLQGVGQGRGSGTLREVPLAGTAMKALAATARPLRTEEVKLIINKWPSTRANEEEKREREKTTQSCRKVVVVVVVVVVSFGLLSFRALAHIQRSCGS